MKLSRITVFFLAYFYLGTTVAECQPPNPPALETIEVLVLHAKTGKPLVGVTIYTEDFSFSTATNMDGKAVLTGLGNREKVIFSYQGNRIFKRKRIVKLPMYNIMRHNGIIEL